MWQPGGFPSTLDSHDLKHGRSSFQTSNDHILPTHAGWPWKMRAKSGKKWVKTSMFMEFLLGKREIIYNDTIKQDLCMVYLPYLPT